MKKILLVLAHPSFEKSKANQILWDVVPEHPLITKHDLYESYPNFFIDVDHEKTLLLNHQIIIFQHPLYWYSCPPLMKQWIDWVLLDGWAYGKGGTHLVGKKWIQAITTGGSETAYSKEGFHGHQIEEFLLPFKRTAELCGMFYQAPFLMQSTFHLTEKEMIEGSLTYKKFILSLVDENYE